MSKSLNIRALQLEVQSLKRENATLLEEKAILDKLIDQLPGPFYIFDKKQRFLRWNRRHVEHSGYSVQECATMMAVDFFAREEHAAVLAEMENILRTGKGTIEATLITKEGKKIPHLYSGTRITLGGEEVLMGFGLDISALKRAESEINDKKITLQQKTNRLEKLNETLRHMLAQREVEKDTIEQSMVSSLKRYVFPYLDELELQNKNDTINVYVDIIRDNIDKLISPVSKKLAGAYLVLTPTEIKVANLICQGQSSKEISKTLNISVSTVEKHRHKIRSKMNISHKKINLQTYLCSLG